jgi:diphosphomevalonate decarboxylase
MPAAVAHANIALVKYWGKRDLEGNRPAAGSLSLTLEGLDTQTRVDLLGADAADDELVLDGVPQTGRPLDRVRTFVDRVRAATGRRERVRVESRNDFPTAAGLASSASAFAALTLATAEAFDHRPGPRALSVLARQGSGSAARSIFGGFVQVVAEVDEPYAEPIADARLELGAAVCVVESPEKDVGSTDGMELTRQTSPYHGAWLEQVSRDLYEARHALSDGDFDRLVTVTEGNCLAMHANAMAARPGLIYFAPATLELIRTVRALRSEGLPCFFTIDAGPHVVVFSSAEDLDRVAGRLEGHPGVVELRRCRAGAGARVIT